jgi:5'-3' exonuclease
VNLPEFYQNNIDDEGFGTFAFESGTPLDSLAQLLSVLPPQSASLLPEPLGRLMLHPSSPLTSYYPSEFVSDPNGKRQSWEAVVQIPFLDADTLRTVVQQVLEEQPSVLTPAEQRRNRRGKEHIFRPPMTNDSATSGTDEMEEFSGKQQRNRPVPTTTTRSSGDSVTRRSTTTTPANSATKQRASSKPRQPSKASNETKSIQQTKPTAQ